jgi:hypothetical protein
VAALNNEKAFPLAVTPCHIKKFTPDAEAFHLDNRRVHVV